MSVPSAVVLDPPVDAREAAPARLAPTRPLYWSVRRELWENRSIHRAPLGVAVFSAVAMFVHAVTMPSHMPGMLANDPLLAPGAVTVIYRVPASLMLLTAFIVAVFYCLDALSSERRDRSILFWKSLPVSDGTTVLAKAIVPLVILPLVTFAAICAMHTALLLMSIAARLVQGQGLASWWNALQLFELWGALLYAVVVMTLWHAPIHGFLLLVSGWARRTAALWAILPLLALGVIEYLTMNTMHVAAMVEHRVHGWYEEAFAIRVPESVPFSAPSTMDPGKFLATPGLWIGLALAAVFIAAAIRMRRYREPI
ncbi:MAG TPA: hypothetical protein VEX86_02630 [Longimicrobium sp.]|nr:hypothetical protein [Longimicrobium sp.]